MWFYGGIQPKKDICKQTIRKNCSMLNILIVQNSKEIDMYSVIYIWEKQYWVWIAIVNRVTWLFGFWFFLLCLALWLWKPEKSTIRHINCVCSMQPRLDSLSPCPHYAHYGVIDYINDCLHYLFFGMGDWVGGFVPYLLAYVKGVLVLIPILAKVK